MERAAEILEEVVHANEDIGPYLGFMKRSNQEQRFFTKICTSADIIEAEFLSIVTPEESPKHEFWHLARSALQAFAHRNSYLISSRVTFCPAIIHLFSWNILSGAD